MKKVVYNDCYGGYGLSPKAIKRYLELARPEVTSAFYKEEWNAGFGSSYIKVDPEIVSSDYCVICLLKDYGDRHDSKSLFDPPFYDPQDYFDYYSIKRSDPYLVQVVEELGREANGHCADLKIAEVNGKYRICEYDGAEWVETPESIKWEE